MLPCFHWTCNLELDEKYCSFNSTLMMISLFSQPCDPQLTPLSHIITDSVQKESIICSVLQCLGSNQSRTHVYLAYACNVVGIAAALACSLLSVCVIYYLLPQYVCSSPILMRIKINTAVKASSCIQSCINLFLSCRDKWVSAVWHMPSLLHKHQRIL